MKHCTCWFFGFLLCGSGCIASSERSNPAGKRLTDGPERWIEELGSNDFQVREAAMRVLMDLDEEPALLRQALQSPDPEVRRRVARIQEAHIPKRAQRGLLKVHALAKEGRVDEMLQRLVLWKDWDKGQEREPVARLIARVIEWEHKHFGKTRFWSEQYISPGHDKRLPREQAILEMLEEKYRGWPDLRCDDFKTKHPFPIDDRNTLVASGSIDLFILERSVIFAAEDVCLDRAAQNSVILCAGDLQVRGLVNCLVIARGTVKCAGAGDCTIISGAPIRMINETCFRNCAILSDGIPNLPIKFFDPQDVGLTVLRTFRGQPTPDGAVFPDKQGNPRPGEEPWIKEIRQGTPFAARLRAGDIIMALDSDKASTKDVFRKVLRKKLAEGGPIITFHVRRDGKELDVPIAVKD